jgi:hypothetical protein
MPARFVITDEILVTLVTTALTLQFAAFGWRIVREIQLGDEGRRTWFLVTDFLIIGSMCALVAICIVLPIAGHREPWAVACTLAVAYIIIAAHPINTAAHYRLFSRWGRWKYRQQGRDVPYVSDQEWVTLGITAAAVGGAVWLMW